MTPFELGYLTAMIDRSGYFTISQKSDKSTGAVLRLTPEIGITIKSVEQTKFITRVLTNKFIAFQLKEKNSSIGGNQYTTFQIIIRKLESLDCLVEVIRTRTVYKEKIAVFADFMQAYKSKDENERLRLYGLMKKMNKVAKYIDN